MFGKSTAMEGSGWLNIETNEINLDLTASGQKITSKPSFLESLAKGLGSAVVKIKVKGKLDDPQIEVTPLPVFTAPLELLSKDR